MKKLLRSAVTALLLSAFAVAQFPKIANCQMALNGVFSARCAMPCCKKSSPIPRCPMLKTEAPKDLIHGSVVTFAATLETVHFLGDALLNYTPRFSGALEKAKLNFYRFFCSPPTKDRAPPATIHLLSA